MLVVVVRGFCGLQIEISIQWIAIVIHQFPSTRNATQTLNASSIFEKKTLSHLKLAQTTQYYFQRSYSLLEQFCQTEGYIVTNYTQKKTLQTINTN